MFTAALFMEIYLATGEICHCTFHCLAVGGYYAYLVTCDLTDVEEPCRVSCIQGVDTKYVATPLYLRACSRCLGICQKEDV